MLLVFKQVKLGKVILLLLLEIVLVKLVKDNRLYQLVFFLAILVNKQMQSQLVIMLVLIHKDKTR